MKVLRMADSNQPTTGKMYHECYELQEHIGQLDMDEDDRQAVTDAFRARWDMLHSDLHAAGYVLDPEYQSHDQHANQEVCPVSCIGITATHWIT